MVVAARLNGGVFFHAGRIRRRDDELARRQHEELLVAVDLGPRPGVHVDALPLTLVDRGLHDAPQQQRPRRSHLERANGERDRQHGGQSLDFLLDTLEARGGDRIIADPVLERLQMQHRRIERAAEVVQETIEVGGQRCPPEIVRARRAHVIRADFTAWIPYFASLL